MKLKFCVSPVLGPIQEHFSEAGISMIQMLVTAPVVAFCTGKNRG